MRLTPEQINQLCGLNPKNHARVKLALDSMGVSPLEKRVQAAVRPPEMTPTNPRGKTCCIITLPHPHKDLKPNGGTAQRYAKARATKAAKTAATYACMNQQPNFRPLWKAVTVEVHAYYTTNRNRDADNLISSLKAAMDGICAAGIIANDKGVVWLPVVWFVDKNAPRIEIRITEVKDLT